MVVSEPYLVPQFLRNVVEGMICGGVGALPCTTIFEKCGRKLDMWW